MVWFDGSKNVAGFREHLRRCGAVVTETPAKTKEKEVVGRF